MPDAADGGRGLRRRGEERHRIRERRVATVRHSERLGGGRLQESLTGLLWAENRPVRLELAGFTVG